MTHATFDWHGSRLLPGEIQNRWKHLTTSDIEECSADRSKLIGMLQTRYGFAERRAEKEVEHFFGQFLDRLRMAA